jgi:TIGR02687 family protein
VDVDFFRLIDHKILDDLRQQILGRTISAGDCANIIWRRRNTHWFREFADFYEALYYASQFMNELDNADLRMDSMPDGIHKYQNTWYQLDQYYRKFIFHVRASNQNTLFGQLIERIENLYSNNYLLKVNDNWQQIVDAAKSWSAAPIQSQAEFFNVHIGEYLTGKNKVAVIISDALRYEIGQELVQAIEKEEGYTANIEPLLSMLPSYTQLGMAALLPHQELTLLKDGNVLVNGQSAQGLENRSKILSGAVEKGAIAFRAEDFLAMNRDRYREVTKGAQVVYIYHDQIDHAGDDKVSEGRVFDVVDKTIEEILNLLKKLYDSYFANVVITSDHGFIYQNQHIDESEFATLEVQGDEIHYRNRRFVLGKGLRQSASVKLYKTEDLGLKGDLEIAIPKSIKRLRLQGSGSRYVHGGAALQEVAIPLIKVNKKRNIATELVEVDIITSSSSIITSGQLSVAFYQTEPVSGKMLARQLRAGIYSQDGTPLSDIHNLNFDLTSENSRDREVRVRFVLSRKADEANNQTVYLRLDELEPGTAHFKEYKTMSYQLRRSFTSDFDV